MIKTIKIILLIMLISINQSSKAGYMYRYKADGYYILNKEINHNTLPVINTESLDVGATNELYSLFLSGSDSDGDILSWSLSGNIPNGISVNSSTGELSGTPTEGGDFNIVIELTDGENFVSKNITWHITEYCEIGPPGTICDSDGAMYVGSLSDNIRRYAAPNDLSSEYRWSTINENINSMSNIDGNANTNVIIQQYPSDVNIAANKCKEELGEEWYLPAFQEQWLIRGYAVELNINTSKYYSSSTQWSTSPNSLRAQNRTTTNLSAVSIDKGVVYPVRCLRH